MSDAGRDQRFFVPQNDGYGAPTRWHKRTVAGLTTLKFFALSALAPLRSNAFSYTSPIAVVLAPKDFASIPIWWSIRR